MPEDLAYVIERDARCQHGAGQAVTQPVGAYVWAARSSTGLSQDVVDRTGLRKTYVRRKVA